MFPTISIYPIVHCIYIQFGIYYVNVFFDDDEFRCRTWLSNMDGNVTTLSLRRYAYYRNKYK